MRRCLARLALIVLVVALLMPVGVGRSLSLNRSNFKMLAPKAITIIPTGNIREDITEELNASLQDDDIGHFKRLVEQSTMSIMDYLLFMITMASLVKQSIVYVDLMTDSLTALQTSYEQDSPYQKHIQALLPICERLRNREAASFSSEKKFFFYNHLFADVGHFSATTTEEDITPQESDQVIQQLFKKEPEEENILLKTIRDELRNPTLTFDDLEFPIQICFFQEGEFENIYIVFAKLKKGNKKVAFTLVVAKDTESKSNLVRKEFKHLRENSSLKVTRVLHQDEAELSPGRTVAVYSSRLMNTSELLLVMEPPYGPGRIWFNSVIPFYKQLLFSQESAIEVISQIVEFITTTYDPESGTMIGNFIMMSGDANVDYSIIDRTNYSKEFKVLPQRKIDLKFVAWREKLEGVSTEQFMRYLLDLKWVQPDLPEINPNFPTQFYIPPHLFGNTPNVILPFIEPSSWPNTQVFLAGIARGLVRGLEARGVENPADVALAWFHNYQKDRPNPFIIANRFNEFFVSEIQKQGDTVSVMGIDESI